MVSRRPMEPLLLATNNAHKIREIGTLLANHGIPFVTPRELGIDVEVEESGTSFEENATLKATAFHEASGRPALADDSGLEVVALGGEPGVRSARYGGAGLSDADRVARLLRALGGVPDANRAARFVAVVAVAGLTPQPQIFRGEVVGRIARQPSGDGGFGYDPVFWYPPLGRTLAELSEGEKAAISHRARAMAAAAQALEPYTWAEDWGSR